MISRKSWAGPLLLLGSLGAAPIRGVHAYARTRMSVKSRLACLMRWSCSSTGNPLHTHTEKQTWSRRTHVNPLLISTAQAKAGRCTPPGVGRGRENQGLLAPMRWRTCSLSVLLDVAKLLTEELTWSTISRLVPGDAAMPAPVMP